MTEILNQPTGATDLTPDELQGLKVPGITTHGELNEIEAVNIEQGLIWLERRPATFDLLTGEAGKEVHRRLFGDVWNWAGQYRLTDKNIGVQVWQISSFSRQSNFSKIQTLHVFVSHRLPAIWPSSSLFLLLHPRNSFSSLDADHTKLAIDFHPLGQNWDQPNEAWCGLASTSLSRHRWDQLLRFLSGKPDHPPAIHSSYSHEPKSVSK